MEFNKIYNADFLSVENEIKPNQFSVIIADPPYNIGKDFGNDSDKQSFEKYFEWCDKWIEICQKALTADGILYIYGFSEILARIAVKYPIRKQRWLVWHYTNKTVPNLHFWQRSHESILALWNNIRPDLQVDLIREEYTESFAKMDGRTRKNTPGRFGKVDTLFTVNDNGALPRDVIKIPALSGSYGHRERWFLCQTCNEVYSPEHFNKHENHDIIKHPTQKPAELTKKLILSNINTDGKLLVPFAGSGSECAVAKQLNIDFIGFEINELYSRIGNEWINNIDMENKVFDENFEW